MGAPTAEDALVEQAQAVLRRLGAAVPASADAATALGQELDAAWRHRPLTVGLTGEDVAVRTALLDRLCGGGLLDPTDRVAGCAALRLRRGARTMFRTTRADGKLEARVMPAPRGPSRDEGPALRARVEALRGEVDTRVAGAEQAERALPALVRARPKPWAFWLWPIRWLQWLLAKDRLAARDHAIAAVTEARRALLEAEHELDAVDAAPRDPHELFIARLRILCSGRNAGAGVQTVELEVASGPLSEDMEVHEVGAPDAEVDEVFTVSSNAVHTVGEDPWLVGRYDDAIVRFPALVIASRARRLADRARALVAAEAAKLDDQLDRARREHDERIGRIEARRIGDPSGFVDSQLERVRPQVITCVHAVLEHASVHLHSELARLTSAWVEMIEGVSSVDQLKAAATRIDEESPGELRRIAGEVRVLVTGGVGGSSHDLFPPLLAALRDHGVPDRLLRAPPGSVALPLDLFPALTGSQGVRLAAALGGAGQWLSGLFRSIETRRAEVIDTVRERANHIAEVAVSELLDTEPRLHAALADILGRDLRGVLASHHSWLEDELTRELEEIDRERGTLEPIARVRDHARRDADVLTALIDERVAR